jgi:hypothetical protein
MIDIGVEPCAQLVISVARQQQIIDAINAGLTANIVQSFCFTGAPGTSKTYLMDAIRRTVLCEQAVVNERVDQVRKDRRLEADRIRRELPFGSHPPGPEPIQHYKFTCPRLITLAEWDQANIDRSRGIPTSYTFDLLTAQNIGLMAEKKRKSINEQEPFETLHIFLDEVDRRTSATVFSSAHFETFLNAVYRNAPRFRLGNDADFVQLIVAMNMSWAEFCRAYGNHVARRIDEMCIRIDFDQEFVIQPTPAPIAQTTLTNDPVAGAPASIVCMIAGE